MPAAPSVNFFTRTSGTVLTNSHWNGHYNTDDVFYDRAEYGAWVCNQSDDCKAFSVRDDGGDGPLIYYQSSHRANENPTTTPSSGWSTYQKKTSPIARKAWNPDTFNETNGTGDPSILANPQTGIMFSNNPQDIWNISGRSGADGSSPLGFTAAGAPPQARDYGCCNSKSSVKAPLGWRISMGDNGPFSAGGGRSHMSADGDNTIHGTPTGDRGDDGIIAENRGFDVFAHWTDMATKGVHVADELQIKKNWCGIQSPSQLVANKSKCVGTSSNGSRILSDTEWAMTLGNACLADTNNNWASQPAVINEMKTIYLGNHDSQGHIESIFKLFCRGDPTNPKATNGHRMDVRCAAINANDFGVSGTSNCFDAANSSFPGCATAEIDNVPYIGLVDLLRPLFNLPPAPAGTAITSANTNPGCLIQSGRLATTNGTDNTFPYQQTVCNPPNLQICGISVQVGAAQNSPINATCDQTMVITPPGSPPSGPAPPPGSPSSGPAPPPAGSPLPVPALGDLGLDTPEKQYGGIGGCICLICVCILIIVALAMSGGGDEGGSTASFLASLSAAGG